MKRRSLILSLIALGVVLLLTFVFAPTQSSVTQGSTYGRRSADYGAWYQWMSDRNIDIEQWRKPFNRLPTEKPLTLIRVHGNLIDTLSEEEQNWVKKGNNLILLGIRKPVTSAPFKSTHSTPHGKVLIETTRRYNRIKDSFLTINHPNQPNIKLANLSAETLLGDEFGAIVSRLSWGKGELILATTPDLGANAYQNAAGNYEFLKEIVTQSGYPIFIDEYLHGYRDTETLTEEVGENLWSYLQKTPFWLVFIQLIIILVVMLWAKNRSFGRLKTIDSPIVNNSRSYIDALAGALEKAEQHDFVMKTIAKDEKNKLTEQLGIKSESSASLTPLINSWSQKTGKSSQDLRSLLQLPKTQSRVKRSELAKWLEKWQTIR
ncbi:MAG: DUF4350 domain-containing protein [Microcystaceae cyanobacterium]